MKSINLLTKHWLFIAASILYLISMFMPVWYSNHTTKHHTGFDVLITGYLGLLVLDPRWFCNIILIVAIRSVFFNKPVKNHLIWIFVAIVASTTIFGPYFIPGVGSLDNGHGMAVGGYLWIASIWLFAYSIKYALYEVIW